MAARLGFVLTSPPAACLPAELLLKRHGHGSCAEKSATPWVCVSDPTFLHLNSTCVFCLLIQKRAKHRTPLWGIRRREMLHPCWQHRFIERPAQTLAGLKISSPSICCAVNSRTCSSYGNSESTSFTARAQLSFILDLTLSGPRGWVCCRPLVFLRPGSKSGRKLALISHRLRRLNGRELSAAHGKMPPVMRLLLEGLCQILKEVFVHLSCQ